MRDSLHRGGVKRKAYVVRAVPPRSCSRLCAERRCERRLLTSDTAGENRLTPLPRAAPPREARRRRGAAPRRCRPVRRRATAGGPGAAVVPTAVRVFSNLTAPDTSDEDLSDVLEDVTEEARNSGKTLSTDIVRPGSLAAYQTVREETKVGDVFLKFEEVNLNMIFFHHQIAIKVSTSKYFKS